MVKFNGILSGVLGLILAGLMAFFGIKSAQRKKKKLKKEENLRKQYQKNAVKLQIYDEKSREIEKKLKDMKEEEPSEVIANIVDNNNARL